MKEKETIDKDKLAKFIGTGIHTYLRKCSNSNEAMIAYKAIRDMPDGEWKDICEEIAEEIIKEMKTKRFDKEEKK